MLKRKSSNMNVLYTAVLTLLYTSLCFSPAAGFWPQLSKCCYDSQLANGKQCYEITSGSGFTNSQFMLPQCPKDLEVDFQLYTRQNRNKYAAITADEASIKASILKPGVKTAFIVHGFTDKGNSTWILNMKNDLLTNDDMNVIVIHWKEGAKGPNYPQATANTRSVGSMLAYLAVSLNSYGGINLNDIHMIGHSLGAHIVGRAGKEVQQMTNNKLGRLTGLDPAAPNFESYPSKVRIDKDDASFVDIIHSDTRDLHEGGFGINKDVGHVDFYPNGGRHQPGCAQLNAGILSLIDFESASANSACNHARAPLYFTNSILKCSYSVRAGDGTECLMGYHATPACHGRLDPVIANPEEPFC